MIGKIGGKVDDTIKEFYKKFLLTFTSKALKNRTALCELLKARRLATSDSKDTNKAIFDAFDCLRKGENFRKGK